MCIRDRIDSVRVTEVEKTVGRDRGFKPPPQFLGNSDTGLIADIRLFTPYHTVLPCGLALDGEKRTRRRPGAPSPKSPALSHLVFEHLYPSGFVTEGLQFTVETEPLNVCQLYHSRQRCMSMIDR